MQTRVPKLRLLHTGQAEYHSLYRFSLQLSFCQAQLPFLSRAHPYFVGKIACTPRPGGPPCIRGYHMHLTEEDIARLTEKHSERLRKAQAGLPEGPMTVASIQKWMVKNNLESPELLETIVLKHGTGATAGKKKMP